MTIYCPISLIDNYPKLFTKVLAKRLSFFISSFVHKDEVGFIPGGQGPDQIRRAVDIISLLQSGWAGGPPLEGLLLFVDLQKAFDSVSWTYMFQVLKSWGFGPLFLRILGALYSQPQAKVRLMGYHSDSIAIRRGTRQCCPLSPLLFAIVLETVAIWDDPNIKGVSCGSRVHKCAPFADDMLFVTSPLPRF